MEWIWKAEDTAVMDIDTGMATINEYGYFRHMGKTANPSGQRSP
jgi:hypothetical protein